MRYGNIRSTIRRRMECHATNSGNTHANKQKPHITDIMPGFALDLSVNCELKVVQITHGKIHRGEYMSR